MIIGRVTVVGPTHPRSPKFGPTETTGLITSVSEGAPRLAAAIAECASAAGVFEEWNAKTAGPLAAAYRLFNVMSDVGDQAIATVLAHPYFAQRMRAPSRKRPAYIAVLLALRPAREEHRKLCSDYACALEWALDRAIPPLEFAQAVAATTLADCKRHIRKKRQSPIGTLTAEEPALTISVARQSSLAHLQLALISPAGERTEISVQLAADTHEMLAPIVNRAAGGEAAATLLDLAVKLGAARFEAAARASAETPGLPDIRRIDVRIPGEPFAASQLDHSSQSAVAPTQERD